MMTATEMVSWITHHWVVTGEWVSVAEIAKATGLSKGAVRRRIDQVLNVSIVSREETRKRYSRDYPGMEFGFTRFRAYAPSREILRKQLLYHKGLSTFEEAVS